VNQTDVQEWPYPECDPPYVKDPADLPAQLKTLATAMDTDITALAASATAAVNPPAGAATGSTGAISTGAALPFTAVEFDNTGGALVSNAADRFNITSDGLWCFIGFCQGTVSAGTFGSQTLNMLVNGTLRDSSTIATLSGATICFNQLVSYQLLQEGDFVSWSQAFPGGSTVTYANLRFAAFRVVLL